MLIDLDLGASVCRRACASVCRSTCNLAAAGRYAYRLGSWCIGMPIDLRYDLRYAAALATLQHLCSCCQGAATCTLFPSALAPYTRCWAHTMLETHNVGDAGCYTHRHVQSCCWTHKILDTRNVLKPTCTSVVCRCSDVYCGVAQHECSLVTPPCQVICECVM